MQKFLANMSLRNFFVAKVFKQTPSRHNKYCHQYLKIWLIKHSTTLTQILQDDDIHFKDSVLCGVIPLAVIQIPRCRISAVDLRQPKGAKQTNMYKTIK